MITSFHFNPLHLSGLKVFHNFRNKDLNELKNSNNRLDSISPIQNHVTVNSGNAISFNGTNFVECSGTSFFNLNDKFTIKISFLGNVDSNYGSILSKYGGANGGWRFRLNATGSLRFQLTSQGDGEYPINITDQNYNDQNYHEAVVVCDTDNKYEFYVDGILKENDVFIPPDIKQTMYNTFIGKNSDNTEFFIGNVYEIQIWNNIASSSDIEFDFNNPEKLFYQAPNSNLSYSDIKVIYNLQEGNGNYIFDVSGEAPVGEFNNVNWINNTSEGPQTVFQNQNHFHLFDGNDDNVTINTVSDPDVFNNGGNVEIGFFKPDDNSNQQTLIGLDDNSTSLRVDASNNRLLFDAQMWDTNRGLWEFTGFNNFNEYVITKLEYDNNSTSNDPSCSIIDDFDGNIISTLTINELETPSGTSSNITGNHIIGDRIATNPFEGMIFRVKTENQNTTIYDVINRGYFWQDIHNNSNDFSINGNPSVITSVAYNKDAFGFEPFYKKENNEIILDGKSYLQAGNWPFGGDTQFTLEFGLYLETRNNSDEEIFSNYTPFSPRVMHLSSDGSIRIEFEDTSNNTYTISISESDYTYQAYNHFTIVFDSGYKAIYVNGDLINETTDSFTLQDKTGDELYILGNPNSSNIQPVGKAKPIRLYNNVLNSDQIKANYNYSKDN